MNTTKSSQQNNETLNIPEGGFLILPLNTLSFPKGQAPKCGLTGYPATCKCVSKHITLVSICCNTHTYIYLYTDIYLYTYISIYL